MTTTIERTAEHGTLTEPKAADSLICVCGVEVAGRGYVTCDEHGVPFHMFDTEALAGTRRIDEIKAGTAHFACAACGRIYSDEAIFKQNSARVVGHLSPAALAAALDLYERTNGFA